MDENKPPEPQTAPPSPAATAPVMSPSTGSGPVPFAGPADSSIPQEHRTQALLSWLLMFVVGFISPLIFYFISADKPHVKYHASMGLAACIAWLVVIIAMVIVGVVLGMISAGLAMIVMLLYMVAGLAFLALVIMGAIAGNAGSTFSPPFVSNVAKAIFKV
jgi:uncharacterized membrane protein